MNIPTENIDEWCFRYLEKDLNEEECVFFENELKNNSNLSKQFSFWKQTVVKAEPLTPFEQTIPNNLFRYRNQFLLALLEGILISTLTIFMICDSKKETQSIKTPEGQNIEAFSTMINNTDSSVVNARLHTSTYLNLLADPKNDSVAVFKNNEFKKLELDTNISTKDQIILIPIQLKQTDSVKVISDTSVSQKKSSQKKSTTKHTYKGSRLIPINNDL